MVLAIHGVTLLSDPTRISTTIVYDNRKQLSTSAASVLLVLRVGLGTRRTYYDQQHKSQKERDPH